MTVAWFHSLPRGWVSRRIKTISPVMRGASPRPIDDPIYFDDDGEYAWVRISDVTASNGSLTSTTQRLSTLGASKSVKLDRGRLFLSIAGSVGKPCITDIKACIHDGFVYFPYLPVESQKFLYWVFESRECFSGLGKLGTQLNLNTETVGNIAIPFPDLATQRQIADFLDRETARIDLLIEKKQRLVALLGEKLQAAISTLVKKGASNPSIRLRRVARLNPSARGLRLEPDALVTFCPMEAIHDGVGGIVTSNTRPISEVASTSYNFFAEGDILLAKVTPCFENGKKALARDLMNGVGFATSEVFVVRVDPKKTSPEYLVYLFSSDDFQYAGRSSMTGAGGLRRISERSILDFPLFVTDRLKQQEIVGEIDNEVEISRKITAKTIASIDRLKEYRSALITAAVTGQIDVSTYAKSGTPDRRLDAIQEEMSA